MGMATVKFPTREYEYLKQARDQLGYKSLRELVFRCVREKVSFHIVEPRKSVRGSIGLLDGDEEFAGTWVDSVSNWLTDPMEILGRELRIKLVWDHQKDAEPMRAATAVRLDYNPEANRT